MVAGMKSVGGAIDTPKPKVLILDDEPEICSLIQRKLSKQGFDCWPVTDPERAMELPNEHQFSVVITDISMPGISGMEILAHVKQRMPACKVILVTGVGNRQTAAQAIMLGAFDYLEKPFDMEELVRVVSRACSDPLSAQLPERAAAAMEYSTNVKKASLESVQALVHAVEAKDPYTRRHSEQVTHYAVSLSEVLGLSEAIAETIRVASLLHDIGMIGVPDALLTKTGPLTVEEFECVHRHSAIGADILKNISMFSQEAILVRHHHEDWSGTGYPAGLVSEGIPLGSRIIRVADSIDAMLMDRTYRKSLPVEKMIGELTRCSGAQFDPKIANVAVQWCRSNPDKLVVPRKPVPVLLS
jgi:putative two-component system response regulator